MSLLDALLLEPYRDPHEVYIALRSDGLKGSGTIDDPYDGGTRFGLALSATLLCERRKFVVGTASAHGLVVNVIVKIAGVKGAGEGWFNATNFVVKEIVSPLHFILEFDPAKTGLPPAPPDVPYSFNGYIYMTPQGGTQVIAHLYWPVAKVTTDSVPHGLPSFGAADVSDINVAGDSRFAGSYAALGPDSTGRSFAYRLTFLPSADVTTPLSCTFTRRIHRFDDVMRAVPTYSVIHLGPGTFETRGLAPIYIAGPSYLDLHVGCVMQAGHRLLGSGIEVSVVKLVLPLDEINQTTAIGGSAYPPVDYAEVADLTVDCNAPGHVAPYGTFPAPVTCGAVGLGGSFIRVHRVRAINFCDQSTAECFVIYLSPGSSGNPPAKFDVIEDCIVEKPGENNTHETTLISTIGEHVLAANRSHIVRRNYHNCEYANGVSSEVVAVASLSGPDANGITTLITKRPHHRIAGQNVLLQLATPSDSLHNRSFIITEVTSTTQLKFYSGPVPPFGGTQAYIGPAFIGRGALSGTGCVTEGNAVFNAYYGFYQDTGTARDVVIRDNYYSNVSTGLNFDFNPGGAGVSEARTAKSLTRSVVNGKFIATFEIPDDVPPGISPPLDVLVGDAVTIQGALIGGFILPAAPYNDTSSVVSVSSDKRQFSYEMKSNPPDNADPPTTQFPISFQSRWEVRRLVFENNVCDFYPFDSTSAVPPIGATTYGYLGGPPFMFQQAVYRDNLFQLIDGTPAVPVANGAHSIAINLYSAENMLVESNLIGIADPWLVRHGESRNVSAFNNRTPAGEALPLIEDTSGFGDTSTFEKRDTLEDKINDALFLSLL